MQSKKGALLQKKCIKGSMLPCAAENGSKQVLYIIVKGYVMALCKHKGLFLL